MAIEEQNVNVLVISNILCITDTCNSAYGKLTPEQLIFYDVRYEEYYETAIDFSNIDVVVIWINFEGLFPDAVVKYKSNKVNGKIIQSTMIEIVEKLYNNVKQKWNGIVLVIGLEDYCYHITQIIGTVPIMNATVDRVNMSIMDFMNKDDYFIDLKRIISEVGYSNSYNAAWKYRWNAPYSLRLYQKVWDEVSNRYCALYKKIRNALFLIVTMSYGEGYWLKTALKRLCLEEILEGSFKIFKDIFCTFTILVYVYAYVVRIQRRMLDIYFKNIVV